MSQCIMTRSNHTSVLISLPTTLAADVDLVLFDPVRGKIKYGARSRLVAGLLLRWLRDKKNVKVEEPETEEINGD